MIENLAGAAFAPHKEVLKIAALAPLHLFGDPGASKGQCSCFLRWNGSDGSLLPDAEIDGGVRGYPRLPWVGFSASLGCALSRRVPDNF